MASSVFPKQQILRSSTNGTHLEESKSSGLSNEKILKISEENLNLQQAKSKAEDQVFLINYYNKKSVLYFF